MRSGYVILALVAVHLACCAAEDALPAVTQATVASSVDPSSVDPSHNTKPGGYCSSHIKKCDTGYSCSCTCQYKRAGSTRHYNPGHHDEDKWAGIGESCSSTRRSKAKRCRPGSYCSCNCVDDASAPVATEDSFDFIDPVDSAPGEVTVSLLDNDADPENQTLTIAPGSVKLLDGTSPGVTVESVDPEEGYVTFYAPEGTTTITAAYKAMDSDGLQSQQAIITGTVSASVASYNDPYPAGTCIKGSTPGLKECRSQPSQCTGTTLKCTAPSTSSGKCYMDEWSKAVPSAGSSSIPRAYCMSDFKKSCDPAVSPDNAGCDKCAIYQVMKKCRGPSGTKPPWTTVCDKTYNTTTHVIVKSRTGVKSSGGVKMCLMPKHWLVMPTRGCTGLDDNAKDCTGDTSHRFWADAVELGQKNFGASNAKWAVMINAPDRRGQHQMHIHIAEFSQNSPFDSLINYSGTIPGPGSKPADIATGKPTFISAWFFSGAKTPADVMNKIKPFTTAQDIHKAQWAGSTKPEDVSYGLALFPYHKQGSATGMVLATVYGFADDQALDQTHNTDCQDPCEPFKP